MSHRITVGEELRYDTDLQAVRTLSGTYAWAKTATLGNSVVTLGDSITAGGDDYTRPSLGDSWPTYAGIISGQKFRVLMNAGIAGNTSAQMLARFDTDVTPYAPNIVTVMAGTNDLASVPLATTAANITAIVAKIRTIGATPILFTIPPRSAYRSAVSLVNAWIRAYALRQNIAVIDANTLFSDPATGAYLSTYDNGDGIHPNATGYAALGQLVSDTLSPILRPWSPMLPTDGNDPNLLCSNACFITDVNADSVPDGWFGGYGGTANRTLSLVAGTGLVKGNWWQNVIASGSGQGVSRDAAGGSFSVGDKLRIVARVDCTAAAVLVVTYNGTSSYMRPLNGPTRPISNGVVLAESIVPVGTTSVTIAFVGNAVGTFKLAQCGLYNLTTMGLVGLGV